MFEFCSMAHEARTLLNFNKIREKSIQLNILLGLVIKRLQIYKDGFLVEIHGPDVALEIFSRQSALAI